MRFEVCVDSITSALAARLGGADRIEVCDNLIEGGTTPSIGLLKSIRKKLNIEMNSMIRPRGGDFLYTEDEFEVMQADVEAAKEVGCDGVVFGILTEQGEVDLDRTRRLVEISRPMSVTFHRAFDMTRHPVKALEVLIDLDIDRVLTSGQKTSALDGMENIRKWVEQSRGRIIVMAGAGINAENLPTIATNTHVEEIHFSARKELNSEMTFRNPEVFMGKVYEPDEYHQKVTDAGRVQEIIQSLIRKSINQH